MKVKIHHQSIAEYVGIQNFSICECIDVQIEKSALVLEQCFFCFLYIVFIKTCFTKYIHFRNIFIKYTYSDVSNEWYASVYIRRNR